MRLLGTKLIENIEHWKDRINRDLPVLLVLDGGMGQGKTTLAVEIADEYQGKTIDLNKQLALGGQDFTAKMRTCYEEHLPVIIYDEAGDFNKRGSISRFNAQLNRTFETFRAYKILIIMCLPSVNTLDESIFAKQVIRALINVYGRTNKQGNYRVYDHSGIMYLRHRMKKIVVTAWAYGQQHPNFYGHFKNLPTERAEELRKISTKGKLDQLIKSEISLSGLVNIREMSSKTYKSIAWVRKKLIEYKAKPAKIIKRVNYYPEEILDRMIEE